MRWRRKREDPISEEAKQARAQADEQCQHAEAAHTEAEQQLAAARRMAATLSCIRERNHFAEALGVALGGNR